MKLKNLIISILLIFALSMVIGCSSTTPKDECVSNADCEVQYESCVTFCGINSIGLKECYFTGELKPNQIAYEYPHCVPHCETGYEWSEGECKIIEISPTYINKEPLINGDVDARILYETEKIMAFIEPLDNDNVFYKFLNNIERYCTKGTLVDSGCKYNVNSESECVPDPDAPYNGITFNPEDMTCITHYKHTRATVQCLVTGEVFDYNLPSEREQLKNCPDCNWFYDVFKAGTKSNVITYLNKYIEVV